MEEVVVDSRAIVELLSMVLGDEGIEQHKEPDTTEISSSPAQGSTQLTSHMYTVSITEERISQARLDQV